MQKLALVLGILLLVVGAVWTFQGYGTLKGSFMTGSPKWMWIGIACMVVGALLLFTALFTNRGGSPP
jgi:uncharacterized membrane protein YhdT